MGENRVQFGQRLFVSPKQTGHRTFLMQAVEAATKIATSFLTGIAVP
ncbi:MAG: hypothetical protein ACHQ03_11865 [Candidatus Bathyarchaeia archaeon]